MRRRLVAAELAETRLSRREPGAERALVGRRVAQPRKRRQVGALQTQASHARVECGDSSPLLRGDLSPSNLQSVPLLLGQKGVLTIDNRSWLLVVASPSKRRNWRCRCATDPQSIAVTPGFDAATAAGNRLGRGQDLVLAAGRARSRCERSGLDLWRSYGTSRCSKLNCQWSDGRNWRFKVKSQRSNGKTKPSQLDFEGSCGTMQQSQVNTKRSCGSSQRAQVRRERSQGWMQWSAGQAKHAQGGRQRSHGESQR